MNLLLEGISTWYGHHNGTLFANRPLTGVTITFIRPLYRVTGVSIGLGVPVDPQKVRIDVEFQVSAIELKCQA